MKPGRISPARGVDDRGSWGSFGQHVGAGAERNELAVPYAHRLEDAAGGVHRLDSAVDDYQVHLCSLPGTAAAAQLTSSDYVAILTQRATPPVGWQLRLALPMRLDWPGAASMAYNAAIHHVI